MRNLLHPINEVVARQARRRRAPTAVKTIARRQQLVDANLWNGKLPAAVRATEYVAE